MYRQYRHEIYFRVVRITETVFQILLTKDFIYGRVTFYT